LGNLMIPSTQAPKWPILVSQWGMDHQKSTILLISDTVSVGGCGGRECYNKPNSRVISQMVSYWEHAESNKKCQIYHNLLKYWFTLFHFALGDPVLNQKNLWPTLIYLFEHLYHCSGTPYSWWLSFQQWHSEN
jgi:hypothetical protein